MRNVLRRVVAAIVAAEAGSLCAELGRVREAVNTTAGVSYVDVSIR